MSDHTDDRRRPPSSGGPHPEGALAGYVDGTATLAERRAVDTHLASCEACWSDLERARSARDVLRALPEIDPPELLLPMGPSGTGEVTPLRPRRDADRWGKAMRGLVAAAAVVVVILGSIVLLHGGGGTSATSGVDHRAAAPAAAASPPLAKDYTAVSMNALATSIARTPFQTIPSASPGGGSGGAESDSNALAIENCARRATKTSGSPFILLSGTFNGRPADIAAFRETSGDSSLVVVVAAQPHTCRALYVASARVPSTSP